MVVLWAAGALLSLSTAAWVLSVVRRDATVVYQLWGMSHVVVAAVCLVAGETRTARSWLGVGLVTVWGLRITAHLGTRDRHRGEDWRHRQARQTQRHFTWRSLPQVFWFELVGGGLGVGLPLFAVVSAPQPGLGWVDGVAVTVWFCGFATEGMADLQLARFRNDPANHGSVLDRGLWRYSRHPNYFGEVVLWIGIALLGVAAGAWWALFSPVAVLVIILRVSGVAVMDKHMLATRGEQYADYVRTTSAFVPLPKRSRS